MLWPEYRSVVLRHRHSLVPAVITLAVLLVMVASSFVAAAEPATGTVSGYRVLKGAAAEKFRVPADMRQVRTWRDSAHDLTYTRYQQYTQPFNALVDGAQLTVVRRGSKAVLVIGAHYPSTGARNRFAVDGPGAIGRAVSSEAVLGNLPSTVRGSLAHRTQLRLDPLTGRLFQHVESGTSGVFVIHQIDAETGAVINAWDGLSHVDPGPGTGVGVKGDRKSLRG